MEMSKNTKGHTLRMKSLAALLPLLIAATSANAVQTGQVTAGQGSISSNGPTTTINQQSDRMIVHWNNFDIAAGEQVQFNQPSATSAVLNRVNSANATQIDGALNANGRVFVVNPNGIVVGKTGSINANGVVLSSLDITSESAFMSPGRRLTFRSYDSGASNGSVVNEGVISAGAAGVSLFGPQVINTATGTISAQGSSATTTSDDMMTVNLIASAYVDADELPLNGSLYTSGYNFWLDGLAINGLLANDGAVKAKEGYVQLAVAAGANPSSQALRNTGSIEVTAAYASTKPVGGVLHLDSYGNSGGTYVGGSLVADNGIGVGVRDDLVIDGNIRSDKGMYFFTSGTGRTLTVADNATLNNGGGWLSLEGDNVAVNGLISSAGTVTVTGYKQANVRQGALHAPSWQIDDGGRITTGSGQN